MKRFHLAVAVAVVVLVGVNSTAFAQYESLGRGRLAGALSNVAIQKEVKLTEEQKQQIKSFGDDRNRELARGLENPNLKERQKVIDELNRRTNEYVKSVLDEEQNKRLEEISLQRDGGMSLLREEVIEKLDLSKAQKEKIEKIREEYTSAKAPRQMGRDRDGQPRFLFSESYAVYKKTNADLLAVLTPAQKEAFEKLQGEKLAYAQPRETPSSAAPKAVFLNNISVGETIIIRPTAEGDGVPIQVVTEKQFRELMPTDEERRLYNEAAKLLEESRTREFNLDELSDEMKQLREKHRSLGNYVSSMRRKMSIKSHTITRVGEDYVAYRDGDQEVFLPAHRIKSIIRPITEAKTR